MSYLTDLTNLAKAFDPAAIAAVAGRKKFGAKKFAKMAVSGKHHKHKTGKPGGGKRFAKLVHKISAEKCIKGWDNTVKQSPAPNKAPSNRWITAQYAKRCDAGCGGKVAAGSKAKLFSTGGYPSKNYLACENCGKAHDAKIAAEKPKEEDF